MKDKSHNELDTSDKHLSLNTLTLLHSVISENSMQIEIVSDSVLFPKIGKSKKQNRYICVRCKTCGSLLYRQVSQLMKGKFLCNICLRDKHCNIAESIGFDLIGKRNETGQNSVFLLRCRKDGHVSEVFAAGLLGGHVRCEQCTIDKWRDILQKYDCEYTGFDDKRVYFKGVDGTPLSCSRAAISRGEFAKSSSSHWKNRTALYLICFYVNEDSVSLKSGFYFKIGVSSDPDSRLNIISLNVSSHLVVLGWYKSRWDAMKVEKSLHSTFSNISLNPSVAEGFTDGVGRVLKDGSMTKTGVTEWFFIGRK